MVQLDEATDMQEKAERKRGVAERRMEKSSHIQRRLEKSLEKETARADALQLKLAQAPVINVDPGPKSGASSPKVLPLRTPSRRAGGFYGMMWIVSCVATRLAAARRLNLHRLCLGPSLGSVRLVTGKGKVATSNPQTHRHAYTYAYLECASGCAAGRRRTFPACAGEQPAG